MDVLTSEQTPKQPARNPAAAVALLAPVISANPLNEPAHRAMMRALARSGRRSEALIVFERLREVLARELAAEPEPQTRRLYQELLAGGDREPGRRTARAAARQPAGPVRLPAAVTPLLGRARELAETDGILARTRLLTLTGPGGAGKTRLAVELARRRAEHYADGAVLVELGALADGELIVAEMAGALRLELPAPYGGGPWTAWCPNCGERHLLDRARQLRASRSMRARGWSAGCCGDVPGSRSWRPAASRCGSKARSPGAPRRWRCRIPQTSRPGDAGGGRLGAAVRRTCRGGRAGLRAHRRQRRPPSPRSAIAWTACRWPSSLPPPACRCCRQPQIAARLSDALTLLSRGDRARITRQQTLAATLAWSHDLLAGDEQVLFRRLAVFAGSFDLDAVEGVCADESPGRAQVLPALGRLVDTSLVLAEPRGDVTRYRLLETVRQYATERLRAAGEEAQQRHRHCAWYVRVRRRRTTPNRRRTSSTWCLPLIDDEHDNLRVALRWSMRREPGTALRTRGRPVAVLAGSGVVRRRPPVAGSRARRRPGAFAAAGACPAGAGRLRRAPRQRTAGSRRSGPGRRRVPRAGDPAGLADALQADAVLAYMRGAWTRCWQRSLAALELARCRRGRRSRGVGAASAGDGVAGPGRAGPSPGGLRRRPCRARLPRRGATAVLHARHARVYGARCARVRARGCTSRRPCCSAAGSGRNRRGRTCCATWRTWPGSPATWMRRRRCSTRRRRRSARSATVTGRRSSSAMPAACTVCAASTPRAGPRWRQACGGGKGLGDRRAIGLTLCNLGVLTASEGDVARGIALLQQGLAGFRETEDVPGRVGASLTMASVYAAAGDFDRGAPAAARKCCGSRGISLAITGPLPGATQC